MEGGTAKMAISELLSSSTEIVTSALTWVGQVVDTITGNPLLLLFVILALVGLGVGLVARLLHVY